MKVSRYALGAERRTRLMRSMAFVAVSAATNGARFAWGVSVASQHLIKDLEVIAITSIGRNALVIQRSRERNSFASPCVCEDIRRRCSQIVQGLSGLSCWGACKMPSTYGRRQFPTVRVKICLVFSPPNAPTPQSPPFTVRRFRRQTSFRKRQFLDQGFETGVDKYLFLQILVSKRIESTSGGINSIKRCGYYKTE